MLDLILYVLLSLGLKYDAKSDGKIYVEQSTVQQVQDKYSDLGGVGSVDAIVVTDTDPAAAQ
jgi:hypothetical protein